jgi:hypothetical protein
MDDDVKSAMPTNQLTDDEHAEVTAAIKRAPSKKTTSPTRRASAPYARRWGSSIRRQQRRSGGR